jgi:hypothetical protein
MNRDPPAAAGPAAPPSPTGRRRPAPRRSGTKWNLKTNLNLRTGLRTCMGRTPSTAGAFHRKSGSDSAVVHLWEQVEGDATAGCLRRALDSLTPQSPLPRDELRWLRTGVPADHTSIGVHVSPACCGAVITQVDTQARPDDQPQRAAPSRSSARAEIVTR